MRLCFLCIMVIVRFSSASQKVCLVGEYTDSSGDCQNCSSECQKCEMKPNQCTQCKPGHFMIYLGGRNRECKEKCDKDEVRIPKEIYYNCTDVAEGCPEGSYYQKSYQDGSKGKCKLCHPSCETCSGPNYSDCTSCNKDDPTCFIASHPLSVNSVEKSAIPDTNCEKSWSPDYLHYVCFFIIGQLAAVIFVVVYFKIRRKNDLSQYDDNKYTNVQLIELMKNETERVEELQIIPSNRIDFGNNRQLLGSGAFGKVYKGTYTDPTERKIAVAIKVIDASKDSDVTHEKERLFDEFRSHHVIPRHPCVIRLLGISMDNEFMLIMPLRYGSLKKYLRALRAPIPRERLDRFCAQIAEGMLHIHKYNVFHCDLKADNVLLKDEFHVEISDFGLACPATDDKGRYRGGTITHTAMELLAPVKNKAFTAECDVWSYGVTVWEIYSMCRQPFYGGNDKNGFVLYQHLQAGGRLEKPGLIEPYLWTFVVQCLAPDPKIRPKFERLYAVFTHTLSEKPFLMESGSTLGTFHK